MALGKKPLQIVEEGEYPLLAKADHWERVPLAHIAKVQNGFAFSSSQFTKDDGLPLIRIRDIDSNITENKYKGEFDNEYIVTKGDILVGMDGDFHAAKWRGPKGLLNQRVCRIIPTSSHFNENFLFVCLQPYLNAINAETSSVTVKHLSSRTLEEIPLPCPPLPEQRRIVEKIEALFSELDKGVEQLKTAAQQLKIYRQSVLKWAFEGKLTEENIVGEKLPTTWRQAKLGEVCDKIQDGSHFSPKVQYNDPSENRFMYVTAKNIRNNFMDLSTVTYIDKEFHDPIYERCNPEHGDVLLTKDGVNTGEVTLNTLREPFSLLSSVCLLKPKKTELNSEFLKYYIQSPIGKKEIIGSMTGTAIKRIVLWKIRVAAVVLPPLERQHQIVQEIESRLSVCDKLEETIAASLQQSEALRQSILKKAFEGKLVEQDPNDPPASQLLEQIKRQKQEDNAGIAKRTKKATSAGR